MQPLDYIKDIKVLLLGIFGKDDANPDPAQVARIGKELTKFNKPHEFYSYDGAGHGFFTPYGRGYRQEQAVNG